jgi:microcystin-dependent protein
VIPTSAHNEALSGDTLYSAFLNYEWREIIVPMIVQGLESLAATIEDETDRQDFEVLYGALLDDLYNEDNMDATPVGAIVAFTRITAPSAKWLYCDGSRVDRSDYPDLWDATPAVWHNQPPTTSPDNIKLPDMRNRFPYGATNSLDLGSTGGEATHTLTTAEMPAHTHAEKSNLGGSTLEGIGRRVDAVSTAVTTATQTDTTGGGGAHNNIPPFTMFGWMIKALP